MLYGKKLYVKRISFSESFPTALPDCFLAGCLKFNKIVISTPTEKIRKPGLLSRNRPIMLLNIRNDRWQVVWHRDCCQPLDVLWQEPNERNHGNFCAQNNPSQEKPEYPFEQTCSLFGKEAQRAYGSLRSQSVDWRRLKLSGRLFGYPRDLPLSPRDESWDDHPAEYGHGTVGNSRGPRDERRRGRKGEVSGWGRHYRQGHGDRGICRRSPDRKGTPLPKPHPVQGSSREA